MISRKLQQLPFEGRQEDGQRLPCLGDCGEFGPYSELLADSRQIFVAVSYPADSPLMMVRGNTSTMRALLAPLPRLRGSQSVPRQPQILQGVPIVRLPQKAVSGQAPDGAKQLGPSLQWRLEQESPIPELFRIVHDPDDRIISWPLAASFIFSSE